MAMAYRSTCVRVHGLLSQGFVSTDARFKGNGLGVLKSAAFSPSSALFRPLLCRLQLEKFVFPRTFPPLNLRKTTCSAGAILESEVKDIGSFVEVGYIADTHGVHGELHVYSLTDFPQERFEKPGKRWVRSKIMGKPVYEEVELLKGREVGGKRPSWLITLQGFNSVEKASDLVGSTLLVSERPTLNDDEYYIPDLVGMSVILKETGEEIGIILDVYNTGGDTDLLQVKRTDGASGQKVWIPFVAEIVPVVDKERRRVEIDPPAGLLELNSSSETKDEKARRRKDVKEKRKLRERFSGLKKKLMAIGQMHILEGLSSGTESQQQELVSQLLSIDFGSFHQAVQDVLPQSESSGRERNKILSKPPPYFPCANWREIDACLEQEEITRSGGNTFRWWKEGLQLIADGRVAVVVLAGGQSTRLGEKGSSVKGAIDLGLAGGKSLFQLQAERLLIIQELSRMVMHVTTKPRIPWIVMTSDATDMSTRAYFEDNKFWGLDKSQVWFLKQASLPCSSMELTEGQHRILLETPWKVAQGPNGNGGLFNALSAQGTNDRLADLGVDYVQVYAVDNTLVRVADPVFFGYTKERGADIGVKVVTRTSAEEAVGVVCMNYEMAEIQGAKGPGSGEYSDNARYGVLEYSNITESLKHATEETEQGRRLEFRAAHICVNIFSLSFLRKLGEPEFELEYHPAVKHIKHVTRQGDEWVAVIPDRPNGIKLERFIFDAFKYSDPSKVALLEVVREEEFAPVKNAPAPGVLDTVDTARRLMNSLSKRFPPLRPSTADIPPTQVVRSLNLAYMGGHIEGNLRDIIGPGAQQESEET
ncbi:hypothetical protein R1flu_019922 [Riccia fluitans]|uniref:UDP-N-acetylglucosamine pyrophosphorylase n=1 Tax=Riccia fluitans TaxID=41844 RepID=A0ABD1ZK16_9MARC